MFWCVGIGGVSWWFGAEPATAGVGGQSPGCGGQRWGLWQYRSPRTRPRLHLWVESTKNFGMLGFILSSLNCVSKVSLLGIDRCQGYRAAAVLNGEQISDKP